MPQEEEKEEGKEVCPNIFFLAIFVLPERDKEIVLCHSEAANKGRTQDPDSRDWRCPPAVTIFLKRKFYQGSNDAQGMLGPGAGLGGDRDSISLRLVHRSTSRVDLLPPVLSLDAEVEGNALGAHMATGTRFELSGPSVSNTEVVVVRHRSLKVIDIDGTMAEKAKQEVTRVIEQRRCSAKWEKPVVTRSADLQRVIEEKVKEGKRRKSSNRRQESRRSLKSLQGGSVFKTTLGEGDGRDENDDGHDDERLGGEMDGDSSDMFNNSAHIRNHIIIILIIESVALPPAAQQDVHMRVGNDHLASERLSIAFDEEVEGPFGVILLRTATRLIVQWTAVVSMILLMLSVGCSGCEESYRDQGRGSTVMPNGVTNTPTLLIVISKPLL